MTRYPRTAPTIASPTPVLPEVGSMMVPPGPSSPSRSAASIIETAIRSLIDPPGFMYSTLATRLPGGCIRDRRTRGVFPMAARTSSKISIRRKPTG
jgi:hypothetical protein